MAASSAEGAPAPPITRARHHTDTHTRQMTHQATGAISQRATGLRCAVDADGAQRERTGIYLFKLIVTGQLVVVSSSSSLVFALSQTVVPLFIYITTALIYSLAFEAMAMAHPMNADRRWIYILSQSKPLISVFHWLPCTAHIRMIAGAEKCLVLSLNLWQCVLVCAENR